MLQNGQTVLPPPIFDGQRWAAPAVPLPCPRCLCMTRAAIWGPYDMPADAEWGLSCRGTAARPEGAPRNATPPHAQQSPRRPPRPTRPVEPLTPGHGPNPGLEAHQRHQAINHGDEFQKRPRKGKETNKVGGVHGGGGGNLQAPAGYATHCQCRAASCCSCAASPRTWMERCCATAPRTSGAVGAARAERRAVGWRRHAC